MFGYVVADASLLTESEQLRYRSAYCGLCRAIGARHGQAARMCLTYDMTFLTLLLDSLYEPEESAGEKRCIAHPAKPRTWRRSPFTDYAADMNVALAYYNCLDDWQDDHNVPRLAAAKVLERHYPAIRERWPGQCAAIEESISRLSALERERCGDLDGVSRCFGALMESLFTPRSDRWSGDLALLGGRLGQFIYLMDAFLDREEDDRRGRYNPISVFESVHGPFDCMRALTVLLGEGTMAFERLPLEQDLNLLRNILYSGVWTRYAMTQQKAAQKLHKEEHPK